MCNKYEHELHENSVPKRYADIITQYEVMQHLEDNFIDDFQQEDQFINETDYKEEASTTSKKSEVVWEELTSLTTEEINIQAKNRINNVKKKIEKNMYCSWRTWEIS